MRKKFAVLLSASYLLAAPSCHVQLEKEEEIEYTATAPVYTSLSRDEWTLTYEIDSRVGDIGYEAYIQFYQQYKNLHKKSANVQFILSHDGIDRFPNGSFHIFTKNNDETTLFIYEHFLLRPNEFEPYLVYDEDELRDGEILWTLSLAIYLPPIKTRLRNKNYDLEFGHTDKSINSHTNNDAYINIYVDSYCIATCFYTCKAPVTKTWFEKYFQKNLILEDMTYATPDFIADFDIDTDSNDKNDA